MTIQGLLNGIYRLLNGAVLVIVASRLARELVEGGSKGILSFIIRALRDVPGVNRIIAMVLSNEVSNAIKELSPANNDTGAASAGVVESTVSRQHSLPSKGMSPESVLATMRAMKAKETHVDEGKIFAYVYRLSQ
eukprot:UC4_evm3s574